MWGDVADTVVSIVLAFRFNLIIEATEGVQIFTG